MALDRETVIGAALRLLNEVGVDGLTLRKLGAELGVQAPALYWHFENKQALVDAMASKVFADAMAEAAEYDDLDDWADWARRYGQGLRAILLRYRDGARLFSGTYLTDRSLYTAMEAALRRFAAAGFSTRAATIGLSTIYCYVVGFTIEEQAVHPHDSPPDARYDPATRAGRMDGMDVPRAAEAGAVLFSALDERFEAGLELIIRGMRP